MVAGAEAAGGKRVALGTGGEQGNRYPDGMTGKTFRTWLLAAGAALLLLPAALVRAEQNDGPPAGAGPGSAAGDMAEFFSQVGDQIYTDCIFELSEEQIEVQQALIEAYIKQGADSALARQLAVKQIRPPKPSEKCEQIKAMAKGEAPPAGTAAPPGSGPSIFKEWTMKVALPKEPPAPKSAPTASLADKKVLPQWDCGPGVDYVTIQHKGYERKLTGGEICNPFDDVVHKVPDRIASFRFGYTITTGRLFVIADDAQVNGKTIAWAISGREACRNNPDPDCLAARALGPLPPGEYVFTGDKEQRVTWGPRSKRMVAGIRLTKLWNRDRFTRTQTAAILARGNIAIHVRLKGEMSEACLGLGPDGWTYVAGLIQEGRATGVSVYVDEPYQQIAEAPPVVKVSSFSLSSLFK